MPEWLQIIRLDTLRQKQLLLSKETAVALQRRHRWQFTYISLRTFQLFVANILSSVLVTEGLRKSVQAPKPADCPCKHHDSPCVAGISVPVIQFHHAAPVSNPGIARSLPLGAHCQT